MSNKLLNAQIFKFLTNIVFLMHPLTKAYVALAIMAGCFIFLYPKIFHPWIRIMFGGGGSSKERMNYSDSFS